MVVYRIRYWDEFKSIALRLSPKIVFYIVQPHPLRRPPLGLRITFYHKKDMYLFIDYADDGVLHNTKIPIINHDDKVKAQIKEEDIILFIKKQLGNVTVSSLPPFMY